MYVNWNNFIFHNCPISAIDDINQEQKISFIP